MYKIYARMLSDVVEHTRTTRQELFSLLNNLDGDEDVREWWIENHSPEEFGWGSNTSWEKYKFRPVAQ